MLFMVNGLSDIIVLLLVSVKFELVKCVGKLVKY